jgi:hypothetical protein
VQDSGNDFADDVPYTVTFTLRADADEANRLSGGVEQPTVKTLALNSSPSPSGAPPTGASYEVSGTISHGHGRLLRHNPYDREGLRGPQDYDAVVSDVDSYTFNLPTGLSDPLDRTWELYWDVDDAPSGGMPHDLTLEVTFCDGDRPDGGSICTPVTTGSRGGRFVIGYSGSSLASWHNTASTSAERQPVFDRSASGGRTATTVRPYGCFCFEPRFIRGQTVNVRVVGVDRDDYAERTYRIRTSYADYPQSYTQTDGGTKSCPAPVFDGGVWYPGCRFTQQ